MATKTAQKALKKQAKLVEKVVKQAAPIAMQAGMAYLTGGTNLASSFLGGGLLNLTGNPVLDEAANAAGGGMSGFIAQGGSNGFDWMSLVNRGIDYLQSGGGAGGYSLSGAVQALRGSVSSGDAPQDPPPPPPPYARQERSGTTNYTPYLIGGGVLLLGALFVLRK